MASKAAHNSVEAQHPEEAGQFLVDLAADPYANLKRLCEKHGLPKAMAQGMIRRMRARALPINEELKRITNKDLLEKIDDRVARILEYMDDYTIANAELRDLSVAFGILAEKRQLLRGEPTQILDNAERKSIDELLQAAMEEAQRRGMTIDVTPFASTVEEGETMRVLPSKQPHEVEYNKTAKRMRRYAPIPEMS